MKSGFLEKPRAVPLPLETEDSAHNATSSAVPSGTAATSDTGRPPPPPAATPEQVAAGLQECLKLLRGPSDERRFVGLLLVTKLLPAGDAATIRQVHDAVGPSFLTRLLLPLRTGGAPPAAPAPDGEAAAEQLQQQEAQCGLALAVLSNFARVPELAASEGLLEKLPLLLNVVRAGGVAPLLAARHGPAGATAADAEAADAAAVQDALECVVAAARIGSEGRAVALECGAAAAAARVLLRSPPGATQQLSLALQLLAAVLAGEEGELAAVGDPEELLSRAMPALARAFALPTEPPSGGGGGQAAQRAALAVQLEALHCLLLLPALPPGASLPPALAAAGAAWPGQLRAGLSLLLRGRVAAVQRHSALRLAAAALGMLGPDWLLGGPSAEEPGPGGSGGGQAPAQPPHAFFQLLVEVAKVETSVLLHDALAPEVPVPLAAAPAPAAPDWRPPQPRGGDGEDGGGEGGSEGGDSAPDAAGVELAADLAVGGGDGADVEPLARVLRSDGERRQLEDAMRQAQAHEAGADGGRSFVQGEFVRRVDDTAMPSGMTWEGPSEASGHRAARLLPCCFALLEGAIEALAADAQRAEGAEGSGSDADGPPPPPPLPAAVAQRALRSLEEAAEVVLQFVEQTSCEEGGGGEAGRHPLMLAALRVVARFCAEVPEAFGDRLRPLLPTLLPLRSDEGPPGGGVLEGLRAPAEGTTFLLPLLLQVTRTGYAAGGERAAEERRLWLDALAAPPAAAAVAKYVRDCAAACVPAVTVGAVQAADDALLYACQLLLALAADGGDGDGDAQRRAARRRRLLRADGVLRLPRRLLRLPALRPVVAPADSKPGHLLHAARLLITVAALAAALAAGLARELQRGGGGEDGVGGDGVGGGSRLWPSEAERAELEAEEEAEERAATRRQRARSSSRERGPPPPPGLGPLTSRCMAALCAQLLAALQVGVQLGCSPAHLALLVTRGGDGPGSPAARLAAARQEAADDEPLRAELARCLDVAGDSAAELLRAYPPLRDACRAHGWVRAELAATLRERGGDASAAGAGGPLDAERLPGVRLFVQTAAEVLGGT